MYKRTLISVAVFAQVFVSPADRQLHSRSDIRMKGKKFPPVGGTGKKGIVLTTKLKEKHSKEAKKLTKQVLREHPAFKAFNDTQTHSTEIYGKTLWKTLLDDKYAHLVKDPKAPSFGMHYYKQVAATFGGESAAAGMLVCSQPGLAVREKVLAGLMAWSDTPKDPEPLMEYFVTAEEDRPY